MKTLKIVLLPIFSLSFLMTGLMILPAKVQATEKAMQCAYPSKLLVLHSQEVCPDKFNADDNFAQWDEMTEHLPEFLPAASGGEENKMTAPELCEHIKELKVRYAGDSERFMEFLALSLVKRSVDNEELEAYLETFRENQVDPEGIANTAVINTLLHGDKKMLNDLLQFFDENNQIKIRIVKEMVDKARYLTLLYDSTIDSCPAYAAEKGYYKIINYNGPDADYDPNSPEEKAKWDALKEKWEKERAAAGRPPLSSIEN